MLSHDIPHVIPSAAATKDSGWPGHRDVSVLLYLRAPKGGGETCLLPLGGAKVWDFSESRYIYYYLFRGFLKWWYPVTDGLQGKIELIKMDDLGVPRF